MSRNSGRVKMYSRLMRRKVLQVVLRFVLNDLRLVLVLFIVDLD